MRKIPLRGALFFVCAGQLMLTAPAHASGISLLSGQMLMLLQSATPNQCISYSYDHNGNITVRSNLAYGATATWGTSIFGCFSWSS